MKKFLLVLAVFVLTIILSGCDAVVDDSNETYVEGATNLQYDEDHDTWFMCVRTNGGSNLDCDVVYTQQEVDVLIFDSRQDFEDDEFKDLVDYVSVIEQDIIDQESVKERNYEIISVEVISVNDNIYLVEASSLFKSEQYIMVTVNNIFEVGDSTFIALYDNGDIRLWNELKEFEDNSEYLQESLIKGLEQRIQEMEILRQYKIHYFSEDQYIFVTYTYNAFEYDIQIFGGCIELCEQTHYQQGYTSISYNQDEFDVWWNGRIAFYQDLMD